jgi:hypothetical protein
MKKHFILLLTIFIILPIITCDNKDSTDIDNLINKAEKLEENLKKNPDDLTLRVSVSKAYQRVGDHFKFIDENIQDINIENLDKKEYIKQLEDSLDNSLKYYNKAKEILEENQFEYKLVEINGKRQIVITHKDPKVVEIFNKIQNEDYQKSNGELDESKFTKEELELKKQWDQRINKIIHYKIGLTHRSLVTIYIAYKNIAENNEDTEQMKKWHDKAIKSTIEAEKHYKISIESDYNYLKAHLALAKLYMYMYDAFQKYERDVKPLKLAGATIDNASVNISGARDNPDLLFVKASINYHLGKHYESLANYYQNFGYEKIAYSNHVLAINLYENTLNVYEDLLKEINNESEDFPKVEKNINQVKEKIKELKGD